MERTYINEAQKAIGGTVKVQGFIENLRNSKYMAFIVLKDITGKLQITVEKEDHPDLVDTIDQLTPDSVITVTGKVVENDYVKMGGVEMIPESIEIESIANALPIVRKEIAATKKKKAVERSSIDQRIDYRWIDLRTDANQLMFKAQSCMVNAMRRFSSTAILIGISQIGENTKAFSDRDPASSRMNAMRTNRFVSMPKFSNQRMRRLGWNGCPFVSPR